MNRILQSSTSLAVYLSLVLIVVRLILDTIGIEDFTRVFHVLLGVLVASYLGIRAQRQLAQKSTLDEVNDLTFVMEIRAAIRPSVLVSLFYSIFIFVFYKFINPNVFTRMINERRMEYEKQFQINNISKEESVAVLENFNEFAQFIFEPFNWATITLFVFVFISVAYSFLLTLIARKIPRFIY